MGLFNFKKKSSVPDINADFGQGFQNQGINDYNSGMGMQSSMPKGGYHDPMLDSNSGLKLADLNSPQDSGMGGVQGGIDSFGNPRVQQRVENYEYRQNSSVSQQDNSKDFQIIIAKLDAIRSEITNINHRLDNIERQQKENPQKKYPW